MATADGRGVTRARVFLTGSDGVSRSVRTGPGGSFRFDDVEAGQTVVVEVRSKRLAFAPRVLFVSDEIADLDFVEGGEGGGPR